ncbi:MAG: CRISPR-associated CARF protein Csa3 [Methanoregulaceae archaeon]
MKRFVSPLGFDTSHILSLLVRYGIDGGDTIVFLMSNKEDERAETAFKNVKAMIHQINGQIGIERVPLDHKNFLGMVKACIDALTCHNQGASGTSVIVNLSGGPREILVALTIASVSHAPLISHSACYSDVNRQLFSIDLPYLTSPIHEREQIVLQDILTNGPTALFDIASRLQLSESSVSRYCARLVSIDLVDLTAKGRNKFAKITPSGEIALAINQERLDIIRSDDVT